jgi:hypothetical protein
LKPQINGRSRASCARDIRTSLYSTDERGLEEITGKITGCAYTVSNTLGCGFLEKVYENALVKLEHVSKSRIKPM